MITIEEVKSEMKAWLVPRVASYRGVLVACSGGIDSMVLTSILLELKQEIPSFSLGIAHVNFGLRGRESDEDQQFVEDFANRHNLPIHVLVVQEKERSARSGESVQEWARQIRREWFAGLGRERFIVAVAHNQNDVAETAILRMARGSAMGQLAGMKAWRAPVWRPLLRVSRAEIAKYAIGQNVPNREDSSNAKLEYSRNRVRHLILSELENLYPGATERIASLAFEARDIVAFVRASLTPHVTQAEGALQGEWLRSLPYGVAIEALGTLLKKHSAVNVQLSRSLLYQILERVQASAQTDVHWGIEVPGGVYVDVSGDQVNVVTGSRTPFPARAQQHQQNLAERKTLVHLEPGAICEVTAPNSSDLDVIACLDPAKPVTIRVETLNTNENLIFFGNDRSWDPRKLTRRWEVAEKPEKVYKRVYRSVWIDNKLIGLYDGSAIAKPSASGDKVPIMPTKTVLRTFRRAGSPS